MIQNIFWTTTFWSVGTEAGAEGEVDEKEEKVGAAVVAVEEETTA